MQNTTLNYTRAFISGATSGLGKELSYLLAKEKIPLFLTGRDLKELQKLQEELQKETEVLICPADLCIETDLQHLLATLRLYPCDLVINNAGCGLYGHILDYSLTEQTTLLKVNIEALTILSIETARILQTLKKKGTILNISSLAAEYIYPSFAIYAASKGFVRDFSLSFDKEVSPLGIRVLVSLPGRFVSSFRQRALQRNQPAFSLSWDTIALTKVAHLLIKQIQKQKTFQIIDFRYQLLHWLSNFFSKNRIALLLQKNIQTIRSK